MGRRKVEVDLEKKGEFELDLAPLLSIMVKLVPVLLLSSAFTQIMILETELPQAVQAAISEDKPETDKVEIELIANYKQGYQITINSTKNGTQRVHIPLNDQNKLNFVGLNEELAKIKSSYTNLFTIDFRPDQEILYQDIIKTMDMARKPIKKELKFKFVDPVTQQESETDFMFPDVNFSNVIEG